MPTETGAVAGCACPGCQSYTNALGPEEAAVAPRGAAYALSSSSGSSEIDGLIAGANYFWGAEATYAFPVTVTYSFMDSIPSYYDSGAITDFQAFNDTMKAAARTALAQYEDAANITFVEVASGGAIQFGTEASTQFAGYAYYPAKTSYGTNTVGFTDLSGDIWISNSFDYNLAPSEGSYGYLTLLHEIGHAMGLKHPHDAPILDPSLDTVTQTVMSYNSGTSPYPGTLGPLDIQALHYLYGTDTAQTLGNLTIDGDGAAALTGDGGQNYFLANGGADTISGGAGGDGLIGNEGADLIFGNEGEDFVLSNQDSDTVFGGSSNDTVYGGQDADLIDGGTGADWLIGNKQNDTIYGGDGADEMYGGQDDDLLVGEGGGDELYGNKGNDTISGGDGFDFFVFGDDSGNDTVADYTAFVDWIKVKSDVNGSGIASASDVLNAISDVGGEAVLDLGGGNTVTFSGVTASQISSLDILVY